MQAATPVFSGDNADLLRAAGRLLDIEGAVAARITAAKPSMEAASPGACWMLSWCDESGQSVERSYDAEGLDELRGQAREQRGGAADGKSGIRAELFRTLGQELDREGAQLGWLN